MTQTQDDQNVGTPVVPAQDANSVAPIQENLDDSVSVTQTDWVETNSEVQEKSLIDDGKELITDTLNSGVEKIKWVWQAWIEWVKSAASQWVESVKDTIEQWWNILKETSQNTIEWIKGVWQNIKEWFWDIVAWVTSGGWVLESWKAVVKWSVTTATNVVWNATTNVIETWTSVVNWAVWAVSNVATSAGNVVKDSINNVAWTVLPEQAAQKVANFQDKVSQWAQDLWTMARETLQETWQKAKWFFANLRDNFKSWFSSKDAQKVMDEVNAPLEVTAQQPATPQVQQPATPQVQQPTAPQVQQPEEVQLWDIQQPTQTNPTV